MSNRKYAAAVLTDGPASIERQMDSACAILAEIMNIAASEVIKETPLDKLGGTESFQSYLDMKYKKMFPELHREYEVIIGTSTIPDTSSWKMVVGWRKRWHPLREAPSYSFSPFGEPRYVSPVSFETEYLGRPYGTGLDVDMLDGYHANGLIRGDGQVRLDTVATTRTLHDIVRNIRDNVETAAYDAFNSGITVDAISDYVNDSLSHHVQMGDIHDARVDSIDYQNGRATVNFSVTPNYSMQTLNMEVNLRP